MNLNDPTTLYLLIGGLSLGFGAVLSVLVNAVIRMKDMGKPWIITLPGTPGAMAKVERRRLRDGAFEIKQGEEGLRFRMAGEAAYPSKKGPVHIITDYGANLVAPSKDAIGADIESGHYELPKVVGANGMVTMSATPKAWADRFRVWDPLLNWRAARENDMEDLYSSDKQKDPWYARIFPFVMILMILLMVGMGLALWKILPLLGGMHGGN